MSALDRFVKFSSIVSGETPEIKSVAGAKNVHDAVYVVGAEGDVAGGGDCHGC